jgi:alanine racemase
MSDHFPVPPFGRPTYAVVNLDAIATNLRAVQGHVSPGVAVMAVVKGNAYGHGGPAIAKVAVEAGASALAVATVDEGLAIRDSGVSAPLVILGPVARREIASALRADLSLAVGSMAEAEAIAALASEHPLSQPHVHVKLDSGMHRYGGTPEEVLAICRLIHYSEHLYLAGVFTHFAAADDEDLQFTNHQAGVLRAVVQRLQEEGIEPASVHAANSAALLRSRDYEFSMVRLGIALYGIEPDPAISLPPGVRPAMTLVSELTRIHELAPGDAVSYGRTYRADARERVGLVPIGYADGLRRGLSQKTWMGKDGLRLPVRGRICMDQTIISLPDGLRAAVGDPVVVGGAAPAEGAPTFSDMANLLDTIPYEVVTGISARVPRWYVQHGEYVAVMRNGRTVPVDSRLEVEDLPAAVSQ